MEIIGALQARRVGEVAPGEAFIGNYGGAFGVIAMAVRRAPAERPEHCIVLTPPAKGVPFLAELPDEVLAVFPDARIVPDGHPAKSSNAQRAKPGGLFITPGAAYMGAKHRANGVWVDLATGLAAEQAGEGEPGLLFVAWRVLTPRLPRSDTLYEFDLGEP